MLPQYGEGFLREWGAHTAAFCGAPGTDAASSGSSSNNTNSTGGVAGSSSGQTFVECLQRCGDAACSLLLPCKGPFFAELLQPVCCCMGSKAPGALSTLVIRQLHDS